MLAMLAAGHPPTAIRFDQTSPHGRPMKLASRPTTNCQQQGLANSPNDLSLTLPEFVFSNPAWGLQPTATADPTPGQKSNRERQI